MPRLYWPNLSRKEACPANCEFSDTILIFDKEHNLQTCTISALHLTCEKKPGSYQFAEQSQFNALILRYIKESNDFGNSEPHPDESLNMGKTETEVRITAKIPSTTSGSDLSVGVIKIDSPRPTGGPIPTQLTPLSRQAKKDLKRYEGLFDKARSKKRACSFSGCVQNKSVIIRYSP
jgi:hypothetical protein